MTRATACRRRQHRHPVSADARVEFNYPGPEGARNSFPLVDISVSGFSFSMAEPLAGIEIGTSIPSAELRVGECVMQGDLMIMHVTPEWSVVGALFYPATDTDLLKMKSMIAGLEAARKA